MRVLLDTQAFLWWVEDDRRLSPGARQAIADPGADVFFSVASAWEMAIKVRVGRLHAPPDMASAVLSQIEANHMTVLPIALTHALRVRDLADHHRDPFDRLLVAQADVENLPLVSADSALDAYGIDRIW